MQLRLNGTELEHEAVVDICSQTLTDRMGTGSRASGVAKIRDLFQKYPFCYETVATKHLWDDHACTLKALGSQVHVRR